MLARELRLDETTIDDIEKKDDSIREQIHQLFYQWHRREIANRDELLEALGRVDLDKAKIRAFKLKGLTINSA